jgi:hypothetical protein
VKLSIKILFFFLPLLALRSLDIVLPIDTFAFRCWEALSTSSPEKFNHAPFYPLQHLQKIEEGDLGHHTPLVIPKSVEWWTDAYGSAEIVLVGDSFVVGVGLDQSDILSEQLSKALGVRVIGVAPTNLNHYFRLAEFKKSPPKLVVLITVERNISLLPPLEPRLEPVYPMTANSTLDGTILGDRFFKNSSVQAGFAYLERSFNCLVHRISPPQTQQVGHGYYDDIFIQRGFRYPKDTNIIFFSGIRANHPVSKKIVLDCTNRLVEYREAVENSGSHFLFMAAPNKESIYADRMEPVQKNSFLEDLDVSLEQHGVDNINLKTFMLAQREPLLYHRDDTHWNLRGARIASEQLIDYIEKHDFLDRDDSRTVLP